MRAGGIHETAMSDQHPAPAAHDAPGRVPDEHGSPDLVEGAHGSTSDHGDDHGHDDHGHDDHGHDGMALGPIDWQMWAVGVVGVLVALIVTAGFVVATNFQFNA
jgi:ABC-type Zn2+ transport system substrate-binding protein/surface adhesin